MPGHNQQRALIAAAIAPLFPSLFFTAMLFCFAQRASFDVALLVFVLAVPTSYLGFFLFGWPLYRFLHARNILAALPLIAMGALAGPATMALLLLILPLAFGASYHVQPSQLAWGAAMGVGVATSFCLLAGIRRRTP